MILHFLRVVKRYLLVFLRLFDFLLKVLNVGVEMYERFVELLQEEGITAYRVSKETGVTQTTLSDWKTGRAIPKTATLQKIADYFGVTLDWLCGNSNTRSSYSNHTDIILVARHLEKIPEEDRQQVIKLIEETIGVYLKAKGLPEEE